jgi:glycine cleavage system H protein
MLKFTDQHEWILVNGASGTVGISDFAQHQLGDVVFVELPSVGKQLTKGCEAAVVESVKAASEVYAPVSGVVTEVNTALQTDPSLINQDPLNGGWFFKMTVENPGELSSLMDETVYLRSVA